MVLMLNALGVEVEFLHHLKKGRFYVYAFGGGLGLDGLLAHGFLCFQGGSGSGRKRRGARGTRSRGATSVLLLAVVAARS